MNITLLDVRSDKRYCQNKEVMGGFGSTFRIGHSLRARLMELAKRMNVNIPVMILGYAAAILRQNGHKARYAHSIKGKPDLVIMHISIVNHKKEMQMAEHIRKNRIAKVGLIGPFVSAMPGLFKDKADFIVVGEPEEFFMSLKGIHIIPSGIVKSRPVDIEKLPFPDWSIFPSTNFSYRPVLMKKPFLPVLTSRGCVFMCNYCPYKSFFGNWRARSVGSVMREVHRNMREYGVKSIMFKDPLFTADKKRAAEICRRMGKTGLEWACETHLASLDTSFIDLMYRNGLRGMNLGVESVKKDILFKSKRAPINVEKETELIKYCEKKGIRVSAFYIFGYPEDTAASINATIDYAISLNTNVAQFSILTPYPGTEMFSKVELTTDDFEQFDSFTLVFRHRNLTPGQMSRLKEKAYIRYYFRFGYAWVFSKRMLRFLLRR